MEIITTKLSFSGERKGSTERESDVLKSHSMLLVEQKINRTSSLSVQWSLLSPLQVECG
jgi:hypothetical protein